jgi:hypothetical protein
MSTFIHIPVQLGQTIYDIAIQAYGHIEAVMLILKDNPSISINADLTGTTLVIRQSLDEVPDVAAARWFRRNQHQVNNSDDDTQYTDAWLNEDGEIWLTENNLFWQT